MALKGLSITNTILDSISKKLLSLIQTCWSCPIKLKFSIMIPDTVWYIIIECIAILYSRQKVRSVTSRIWIFVKILPTMVFQFVMNIKFIKASPYLS